MGCVIEFKQSIFVAKSKNHSQKAFQTDDMDIRYNCVKRYHVFYINYAKGILLVLVNVPNFIIFFTYMTSSFFNNSLNQGLSIDCSYLKRPTRAQFRMVVDIKSCGNCLNQANAYTLQKTPPTRAKCAKRIICAKRIGWTVWFGQNQSIAHGNGATRTKTGSATKTMSPLSSMWET